MNHGNFVTLGVFITLCIGFFCATCRSSNTMSSADITIGLRGENIFIVIPDDKWVNPENWDKLPKRINHNSPQKVNMVLLGAQLLGEYVKKITNIELDIISEHQWEKRNCPTAILVGRTHVTISQFGNGLDPRKLKRGGYLLKSIPGKLFICGSNAWATYCGCASFLEEYCGVEWFWPTQLGEEVPTKSVLAFADIDVSFEPAMTFSHYGRGYPEWWARIGERPSEWKMVHGLGLIYYDGRHTHPEWFPLVNGKRIIPGSKEINKFASWQPCMWGPSSLERVVAKVKRYFREHPDEKSINLGLNDGAWRGCECDYCRANDGEIKPVFLTSTSCFYNGYFSQRYYSFLTYIANAIKKEFPGKIISGFAYSATDTPPMDAHLNNNLALGVVSSRMAWLNPKIRKWEKLRHEYWSQFTNHLSSYDYMYQIGYIPVYAPHIEAEVIRLLWENHFSMVFAETCETMARAGPRYWIFAKMCNDPTRNVDVLLNRWMRGMFKEAAVPMAEYYRAIEQAWIKYPYHEIFAIGWSAYCFNFGVDFPVLTPETIAKLDECLARAQTLAMDVKVKARIDLIRKNYIPTREAAKLIWRQRPYRNPVPFDDEMVIQDLKEHESRLVPFNAKDYYDTNCKDDPLSHMHRLTAPFPDTPAKRMGRIVDGILLKSLSDTDKNHVDLRSVEMESTTRMNALADEAHVSLGKKRDHKISHRQNS